MSCHSLLCVTTPFYACFSYCQCCHFALFSIRQNKNKTPCNFIHTCSTDLLRYVLCGKNKDMKYYCLLIKLQSGKHRTILILGSRSSCKIGLSILHGVSQLCSKHYQQYTQATNTYCFPCEKVGAPGRLLIYTCPVVNMSISIKSCTATILL